MNSQEVCEHNRLLHLKNIAGIIHCAIEFNHFTDRDAVNALMANVCERLRKLKDSDLAAVCVRQLAIVIGMIDRENNPCST
ncbi:MAG: hypothetical protein WA843_01385 [Candidatus Saccharimonadales bacterium]